MTSVLASLLLLTATWLAPVTPLVIERPFTAPAGPYSPGHRGVDLELTPGAAVRAPAHGIVRVAGRVAGKYVVSIEHPHRILGRVGWRTTYDGVLAAVEPGTHVKRGDVIGTAVGSIVGDAHTHGLHWGLKRGRTYADPLLLLRRTVVLKPLGRPRTGPPQWSRAAAMRQLLATS